MVFCLVKQMGDVFMQTEEEEQMLEAPKHHTYKKSIEIKKNEWHELIHKRLVRWLHQKSLVIALP
jgi:hypothetical protein